MDKLECLPRRLTRSCQSCTFSAKYAAMQTEWTQKGRLFLYEELKKHGIYPMIERMDNAADQEDTALAAEQSGKKGRHD